MRPHFILDGDGELLTDGDGELLTELGADPPSQPLAADPYFRDATSADYLGGMQALLPSGPLWRRDDASRLTILLTAIADGLARLHGRVVRLLDECDPRQTLELLPEWETLLGLPDACTGIPETLQERRRLVTARWTARGGQSPAYYIGLAATLGYPISIEEGTLFRADESRVDEDQINDLSWAYTWTVHAPESVETPFRADESCADEPLLSFGNEALECAITRVAPAHTIVLFAYGD